MTETCPPLECLLCNAHGGITPAGFHQVYRQNDTAPALLDWWECWSCRGWFVHPVPDPETISRQWGTVGYTDIERADEIAEAKKPVQTRILRGLACWTKPGPLLDFGCNFGHFLLLARQAGWTPVGFEPNETAAKIARSKSFDVRCGWLLKEVGFAENTFAAITANDSFCLVWHPFATLQTFHRLLAPGGVLAMRLTNKRFVLGVVKSVSAKGPTINNRISRLLQGQFHAIGLAPLTRILRAIGFDDVRVEPHATTAPWKDLLWQTRIAYLGADLVHFLSLTRINLSPGVLVFARKAVS